MRRLLWVVLLALLALPLAAFAQEPELGYELDPENYLDVEDLGFRFLFPVGWVYGVDNGIYIAESQADLDAHLDGDDSTTAQGLTMSITGIPLDQLPELATVEDAADLLVEVGGIREDERVEVPVMTRRSISILGENTNQRYGIGTVWLTDDYMVAVSIGGPEQQQIIDLAYTWGVTIGSITPIVALPLGDQTIESIQSNFAFQYPEGWVQNPDIPGSVYEFESDFTAEVTAAEGVLIFGGELTLEDRGLPDDTTAADLAAANAAAFSLPEPERLAEFVLLEQPAVIFKGEDSQGSGRWIMITQFILDGRAISLVVIAPSEEAMTAFEPTWVSMLQSLKPADTLQ